MNIFSELLINSLFKKILQIKLIFKIYVLIYVALIDKKLKH